MADPQIYPGARIGGYTIRETIGQGGMGLVFKAYHERLHRWAAIKVLVHYGRRSDEMTRFEREAQAVASLRHPNILTIFDFGEYEGQPYMVTEYMANGSLDARMPDRAAALTSVNSLLRPLAAALDYAHEQGVVHRDVKPANVFLDEQFRPVLADFGLAKLHRAASITVTGLVSGTPSHMSPEQARGLPLSGASDQYSLAVIAYAFLTGQLPFNGASPLDVLYSHVNDKPPAPSSIVPELSPAVDAVIGRALAKQPLERWPTCGAFAASLAAALEGNPDVGALEAASGAPSAPTVVALPAAGPSAAKGWAHGRRRTLRRALLPAATLAAVLLAGGGVYGLHLGPFAEGEPEPADPPSPAVSPAATQSPARFLRVEPAGPLKIGSQVTVSGCCLDPKRSANIGVLQAGNVHPLLSVDLPVGPDGSFLAAGEIPKALQPGSAPLLACNLDGNVSDSKSCLQLTVQLIR